MGPSLGGPRLGASSLEAWEGLATSLLFSPWLPCSLVRGGNLAASERKGTATSAFKGLLSVSITVASDLSAFALPSTPSLPLTFLSFSSSTTPARGPAGEIIAGGRMGKKGSMRGFSAAKVSSKCSCERATGRAEAGEALEGS